jgi:hypothetical protein
VFFEFALRVAPGFQHVPHAVLGGSPGPSAMARMVIQDAASFKRERRAQSLTAETSVTVLRV